MKTILNILGYKGKKPLNAKQKEEIMTICGAVFIIVLTVTSAFSIDIRNKNIVATLNETHNVLKG